VKITKGTANNKSTDAISYYKKFPPSRRSNLHATQANTGLINANVICYSNAIFQCVASCANLTDFLRSPPNEEHQHFELYYKFRSVISSMVSGGIGDVDPSKFINLYKKRNEDFITNEG
jgi:ubiquitin C-terminal hydrolase